MSYAARLAAMSRGTVPHVAPRTEAVHEAQIERDVLPMTSAARAPEIAATQHAPQRPAPAGAAADLAVPGAREQIERELVEHAVLPRPGSPSPSSTATEDGTEDASQHVTEIERIVLPSAAAPWLAETAGAPDPLVASADTDALRDVMRSVRQWTGSPPTIIDTAAPVDSMHTREQVATGVAAQPIQVSIGNVVVTVEDAPHTTTGGRAATPARSHGDRFARNHIRGS